MNPKSAAAPRDEAQLASTGPDSSVWVAANAGTGKTKVLTDRILRLLLAGAKPSRILCLTFTKAAATEMRVRLAAQLGRWATLDEASLARSLMQLEDHTPDATLLARARGLFAQVLDAPGGLPIQTLHSFCQSLLKRFPIESGIAPHFAVMEDHHAREILLRAQRQLLADLGLPGADAGLREDLREISALIGEQSFAETLTQMVGERGRIERLKRRHGSLDGVIADLAQRLEVGDGDLDGTLLAACAESSGDLASLRRCMGALAQGTAANQEAAQCMAAWLEADLALRVQSFEQWRLVFLTKDHTPRKIAKKLADQYPWLAEAFAAEAERLMALIDRLQAIRLWRATSALLRLSQAVIKRYGDAKTAEARLDYDDQITAARRLLSRAGIAPWVLYKLDGGIDHVLIDEAQDTNAEQWEVVQKLTEEFFAGHGAIERPRTLFVVGDAKQSIFSFQRADPREFARMRDYFAARIGAAGAPWRQEELVVSYRSTQPILDAVDAIFAHPPANDGLFEQRTVHKVSAQRAGDGGRVEIWPPVQGIESATPEPWELPDRIGSDNAPELRLARAMAEHIRRMIADGEMLPSRGRKIEAGDILILVRRRNELVEHLVRELKANGIEVAGVDRMVLTDQLAVMDLVGLGDFLLQPDDDLNLAALLKSPLVGLDEEALMALAIGRKARLWPQLRARAQEPAFAAAHRYLADLLAKADFITPYALYAEVLGPRGGRYALQARLGHDAADPIDEFLALALAYERNEVASLQGFLHWLKAGGNEIKRELDQARGQVRIMTVHGAKGLQAPIVYLPDTCQKPNSGQDRILWSDDESMLIWAARADLLDSRGRAIKEQAARRAAQEYRRLLYVALTRAADRLYVCGYWNKQPPAADSWYELIRAGLADERRQIDFNNKAAIGEDGWQGIGLLYEKQQEQPPQPVPAAAAAAALALPAWAHQPAPREKIPPQPLAPSRAAADQAAQAGEPAAFSPLASADLQRFQRGLLIHRLLQSLPSLPTGKRAAAARRFLKQKVHNLAASQQSDLARETLAVLGAPEFAAIFGPASRAEVPLAGRIEGRGGAYIVSGQVDRLCVLEDRVVIVDYKTNRPPPIRVEDVPALYLRQMAAYRALLMKIYPGRRVECLLLWTAIPELMALPEALLEAHNP